MTFLAALQPVHVTVTTAGSSIPWVLFTGLITAAAALAGVWLTQRAAGRQKTEERQAARNVEQRDAIAELIDAIEQWTPRARLVSNQLLSVSVATLRTMWESEEAQAATAGLQRVRSALVRCRLVVTDEQTRPVVLRIDEALRLADGVNDKLIEVALTNHTGDWPAAIHSFRDYYDVMDERTRELTDAALRHLT